MNKAIFLDRDGVIIEDAGYPHRSEDLVLIESILPYLQFGKEKGFLLIIVTNQSGIARGIFTVEEYERFQEYVEYILMCRNIFIDKTYYCPFHIEGNIEKYSINHNDRKPNPGMILKAIVDFDIDIELSIMIGDRESDIIQLPGLRSYLIRGNYPVDRNIQVYESYEEIFKDAGII